MHSPPTFTERLDARRQGMSPAEQHVARFFRDNREEVLISSASRLAEQCGTSDATVIRTAKALGFAGMHDLRRALAKELRGDLSPAGRLARTLGEVGEDLSAALDMTLDIHQQSIEALRRDVSPEQFAQAVQYVLDAGRVFIFGIGPSGPMADYFTIQLGRFGIDARSLTHTGLLLADDLHKIGEGDLLMIFAYSRVYRELEVLLGEAKRAGVPSILFTDTLGQTLHDRVELIFPVARGRTDLLSMHTATVASIETLLIGIAASRPAQTIASLKALNALRDQLAGEAMGLPVSETGA